MGLKKEAREIDGGEGKKRWLVEKNSSEITDLTGSKI
jgi:hypothetical protein